MNNKGNGLPVSVVNIKDIIWNLLSQWKAVLIIAVIMSFAMTGYKYYKDTGSYNKDQAQKKQAAEMTEASAEEKAAEVLKRLPEEDRASVEYMIQQKEWVAEQKDYINNSILMNVDPTSQRTLILDYYIASAEEKDSIATSLLYGYSSYINSEQVTEALRQVIDPNTESRYITELISTPTNNSAYTSSNNYITSTDDGDAVMEIKVVIPEETDAAAVEDIITSSIKEYSGELSKKISPHSISLIRVDEARLFNNDVVNNRNHIITSVYNIQNNYIRNLESTLSDEQKAAMNTIIAIKSAVNTTDVQTEGLEDTAKPGISKKYALFGFVLGAMLYAFVYCLYVILKGEITSAGQAEIYTSSRLLGEIYIKNYNKGIRGLFRSNLVDNIRFKGKLDEEKQKSKTASTIEAISKYAKTEKFSFLCMPGLANEDKGIVESLSAAAKVNGIDSDLFNVSDPVDEIKLIEIKNCVIVSGNKSNYEEMINTAKLCKEYCINILGNIYIQRT